MKESTMYQAIRREGEEIGEEKGIKKGIEQVVRNLLKSGMSLDQSAAFTSLSVERLQGLFKELQALPSSLALTEEAIAEEVDAYRQLAR